MSGAESQQSEVRVQFNENDNKDAEESKDDQSVDQESAASGGNNGAIDDLSLDDADASDENRNKRYDFDDYDNDLFTNGICSLIL